MRQFVPRILPELTARQIAELPAGMHRVSRNLWLRNNPPAASWIMIFTCPLRHRQEMMGLGSRAIPVAEIRARVMEHRLAVFHGRCPACEKREVRVARQQVVSFGEVAGHYLTAHRAAWRSAEHARQWDQALKVQAAAIWETPVGAIDTGAVMRVLEPLWHSKTQTAARLRGRIEKILDFATSRGWRSGENVARWKGHLSHLLPSAKKLRPAVHHEALDWRDAPALWAELAARGEADMPALALRFTIATNARRGEVLGAKWDEIDLFSHVWTIPASRMKAGREHRVPLSDAALDTLRGLTALRRDHWLFPGTNHGRPIGPTSLLDLLRTLRPDVTVHGFRSSFADWAKAHGVSVDLREAALAHKIQDVTRAAYERSDLLEERRPAMTRWGIS
jgi:integrase